MSAATSASSSKPCSIASTPPATPASAPDNRPLWAVTFAPRAWAASTTRRDLTGGPRRRVRIRPVEVELQEVGAVVELADRVRQQLVGRCRPRPVCAAGGSVPRLVEPRAGGPDVREVRPRRPAIPNAEAQRPPPAVDRVLDVRRADVAGPADACAGQQPPLRSATSSESSSGGSSMRSIQWAPPGQGDVAVAVDHARDDRGAARVDDLEAVGGARVLLGVGRADPARSTGRRRRGR